jgi:hypothetical protein
MFIYKRGKVHIYDYLNARKEFHWFIFILINPSFTITAVIVKVQ